MGEKPYRLFYRASGHGDVWRRLAFADAERRYHAAAALRLDGYEVETYDVLRLPIEQKDTAARVEG